MLIEFTVGNYKSFRDKATLSLLATKLKGQTKEKNRIRLKDGTELLRSAVVYGPNASGKTNIVDALAFARLFVRNSSREGQAGDKIEVEPFRLSTETTGKPSYFEFVFLIDGVQYRYGFEASTEQIEREWLYTVPAKRETLLFKRQGQSISANKSRFPEGSGLEKKTRKEALFLSVCAQFNGQLSTQIVQWFDHLAPVYMYLFDQVRQSSNEMLRLGDPIQGELKTLLRRLDLGFDDIELEEGTKNGPEDSPATNNRTAQPRVKTKHRVFDSKGKPTGDVFFDLDRNESIGTKQLYGLAGMLVFCLEFGGVLVIDELDAQLHQLLTLDLLSLFNSPKTNKSNAQLIFTTHNTALLSNKVFRRDQIWFVEKGRQGESKLYSLAEFKEREDSPFNKHYLEGQYGAVPRIRPVSTGKDSGDAEAD